MILTSIVFMVLINHQTSQRPGGPTSRGAAMTTPTQHEGRFQGPGWSLYQMEINVVKIKTTVNHPRLATGKQPPIKKNNDDWGMASGIVLSHILADQRSRPTNITEGSAFGSPVVFFVGPFW